MQHRPVRSSKKRAPKDKVIYWFITRSQLMQPKYLHILPRRTSEGNPIFHLLWTTPSYQESSNRCWDQRRQNRSYRWKEVVVVPNRLVSTRLQWWAKLKEHIQLCWSRQCFQLTFPTLDNICFNHCSLIAKQNVKYFTTSNSSNSHLSVPPCEF